MGFRRLFAAVLTAALPLAAMAQGTPARIIVLFTASGASDVVARGLICQPSRKWNQVEGETKTGAGGTIAASYATSARPDGRTQVIVASGHAINELVHDKLPYRTVEDFTAVARRASGCRTCPASIPWPKRACLVT